MILRLLEINNSTTVGEVISKNYRTPDVFRKYGIDSQCAEKSIEAVCNEKGISFETLKKELLNCGPDTQLPAAPGFREMPVDFLVDYIINIHHFYLKNALEGIGYLMDNFGAEDSSEYAQYIPLKKIFTRIKKEVTGQIYMEATSLFPYIRQVASLHKNKDSYAALLVRTLRKPIELLKQQEQGVLVNSIFKLRELSGNYIISEKDSCEHKIIMRKLHDLDRNLVQYIYLENEILLPKATRIEQELLNEIQEA